MNPLFPMTFTKKLSKKDFSIRTLTCDSLDESSNELIVNNAVTGQLLSVAFIIYNVTRL